jgi:hypothetical protein
MDLKNMMGGGVLKYIIIGAVASVVPALITKFLPSVSGLLLGVGMIVGGAFLMGKVPIAPQALIVAGGITVLGGFLSGFLNGASSGTTSTSGATFA